MTLRQKLVLVVGAAALAACSTPTAPKSCDVVTMGSSRCAAN